MQRADIALSACRFDVLLIQTWHTQHFAPKKDERHTHNVSDKREKQINLLLQMANKSSNHCATFSQNEMLIHPIFRSREISLEAFLVCNVRTASTMYDRDHSTSL